MTSLKELRYTKPVFNALVKEAPQHIRNIKTAIKSRFASLGLTGKILSTSEELNGFSKITAVGTVAPFIYSVNMHVPFGWYELNGQTVNGIKLKDMRGRMVKNAKSLRFNGNEDGQYKGKYLTEDTIMKTEHTPAHKHNTASGTTYWEVLGGYLGNAHGGAYVYEVGPDNVLPSTNYGRSSTTTVPHKHGDVPVEFDLTPQSLKVIYYTYLGV